MLRSMVSFSLMLLASSWVYPHFQSGFGVGPEYNQEGNVLQTGKDAGRSVDYEVNFAAPFENIPEVAIAVHQLDWQANAQIGYSVDLVQVSNKGFKVKAQALGTGSVYSVKISWFATDDPRIKVQFLESDQVGTLQTGEGARSQEFQVPFGFDLTDKNVPQAAAYLLGVNFVQGEPLSIKTEVSDRSYRQVGGINGEKGVTIKLSTASNTRVSFVKLCLITSTYESFASSQKLGARPVPSHAWTTGQGERMEEAQMPYVNDLKNGDRGSLFGFTGYETRNQNANTRLTIRPVLLGQRFISTKYGTWGDSRPVEMNLAIMVYKPNTYKVFSNQCAEVFAQCNFEGDTFKLCDRNLDFKQNGFAGPVKSVYVPPGKAVQLYNRVGLEGKQVVFKESQECLEGITFSLF